MEENINLLSEKEVYDSKSGKGFKKIFKNFSFLTFGKLGGDFFTFILFVVLSRKFGSVGIGEYSFAVGLTGFFAVCSDFGLYSYTVKEISRHKNASENYFSKVFSLRIAQSVIVIILLLAILPFLGFSQEGKTIILIIGVYQVIYTFIDGISAVFIAHEFMHISAGIEASLKIATSFTAVSIALLGGGIVLALLALPIVAFIQLFAVRQVLRKRIGKTKLSFSIDSLKDTFRHAIPFGTSDFLNQLFNRIDIVLIGFLLGDSPAGIYNVGYRIVFFFSFVPRFASVAFFPIVSRLFHQSKSEFRKMYNKSLSMMIIIGLPVSAGLWLIAPKFIELVFGPNFAESATILRIFSWLFIALCFVQIMEVFLMSSDHQVKMAKGQWVVTWISVVLNVVLIYFLGIIGAAIAVLTSSVILVFIFAVDLKSIIGVPHIWSRLLIGILGIAAFCIPLMLMNQLSIFLIIPAAAIIYLGIMLSFKDVRRNELRMVLSLFSAPK